jgi:hypothetical protein
MLGLLTLEKNLPKRKKTVGDGYYCVVCGRFIEANEDGVIVHDAVPHPPDMDFAEEEKPQ